MGDLRLQVGGQIDDMDCTKWTFLWANTTTNAQPFRDKRDFRVWCDFNAEFAGTDHWARLFAFLATFLHTASQFDRSIEAGIQRH